jgi:hypothetical protein
MKGMFGLAHRTNGHIMRHGKVNGLHSFTSSEPISIIQSKRIIDDSILD